MTGTSLAPVPAAADQNDPRLDALFEGLRSNADLADIDTLEARIWGIWGESGREEVDDLMRSGGRAMESGHLNAAIELFGRAIEAAPGFAEAWNKRATAYYLNRDMDASVRDIERTLALEPRHFGAISGMGLIFLARGDAEGALRAFEQVLEIHPSAAGARQHARELRALQRSKGI